jgi:tetratricopeptide (TPR) repeat protein
MPVNLAQLTPDHRDSQALVQWAVSASQLTAAQARITRLYHIQHDYDRLNLEYPNIYKTLNWLCEQTSEEALELLLEYLSLLAPYLRQRNLDFDLLRWCQVATRAYPREGWLWHLTGQAQNALALRDEAVQSFQYAMTTSEGLDTYVYALTVLDLGRLRINQGDYLVALPLLSTAERLLQAEGDIKHVLVAQEELIFNYIRQNEPDKALSLHKDMERKQQELLAGETMDNTLLLIGVSYRRRQQHDLAHAYLQQLLARAEAQKSRSGIATASHHLAWVYLEQGQCNLARRLCGRAIALYEEIGDIRGLSDAHEQLGCIALEEHRVQDALFYLNKCLPVRQQIQSRYGMASCLRRLAIAYLQARAPLKAAHALVQSLLLYKTMGILNWQRLRAIKREFCHYLLGWPR